MPMSGAVLAAAPMRRAACSTEFLVPGDEVWLDLLNEVRADVYYLPGYVALTAREEGGEPLLFVARDGGNIWLIPLIVRPVPGDLGASELRDAVTPYGYSGPLMRVANGTDAGEWAARAAAALRVALARRGIVSLFARLHPLRPLPVESLAGTGTIFEHGDTVVVDLAQSPEMLWQQTRSRCRSHIRALERDGFVAAMDPGFARVDQFRAIYDETMRRVGAAKRYFFSTWYYEDLRYALGERLHLCVVERAGQVVCAGLFTEMHGTVQYHLGGTRTASLPTHPAELMMHFVRRWAKDRGNREFHLGGGRGGAADSLLHFKQGFSKHMAPFATWRMVADPGAYAMLVARWRVLHSDAAADAAGHYFPAYRLRGAST